MNVRSRVSAGAIPAAIALVLGLVYWSNGTVLPGRDAAGSVYLAAAVVDQGRLTFTPSSTPWVFVWKWSDGRPVGPVFSMDEPVLDGWTAGAAYAAGAVRPVRPYFLARSVLRDATTGEQLSVNTFGPGAALTAVPALALVRLAGIGPLVRRPEVLWFAGKATAALLVAASAVVIYFTALRWAPRWAAVVLMLLYGLGTAVWSTSSQTLWQHASAGLFVTSAVALLLTRSRDPGVRRACVAGLLLGLATVCRPTIALVAIVAAGYLALHDRRAFLGLVAGGLPIALLLAAYNHHYLGSVLAFGQTEASRQIAQWKTGSPELWQTPLHVGLAGVLLSPSRGLFVFSPWLALAVVGSVAAWRRAELAPFRWITVATAALLLVESAWFDWWGGWSFGYRRVVDLVPLLTILSIPVLAETATHRVARPLLAVAAAWSIAVQVLGAFAYDLDGWNARRMLRLDLASGSRVEVDPDEVGRTIDPAAIRRVEQVELDVDTREHRVRLWSGRDSQILYYASRFRQSLEARRSAHDQWIASWKPPR
jgi:hypothetical protein